MTLLTSIASMFAHHWQPMHHAPPPITTGRGLNKPCQRQAKRRRARQRAKRLKHY